MHSGLCMQLSSAILPLLSRAVDLHVSSPRSPPIQTRARFEGGGGGGGGGGPRPHQHFITDISTKMVF